MRRTSNSNYSYNSRARNHRNNYCANYGENTRRHHYNSGCNSFGIGKLRQIIADHANNPNVLLLCLQNEKTLLSVIADDSELKGYDGSYELLRAIMEAFAIICDSDPDILLPFITRVCGTDFHQQILNYLLRFVAFVDDSTKRDSHLDTFRNIAKFVRQIQSMLPQSSREKVKILLISLNDVLLKCNKKEVIISQSTIDLLNAIKTADEKTSTKTDFDDNAAKVERMHALLRPPNNFREMSIYPTLEDIHGSETPFLRSNIIKGKYFDVDHYLDVQFRLLREDYVRPLREGIASYLIAIKDNQKVSKLKDVRVYSNVHILRSELRGELVFHAQFDATSLVHVNWQMSKRLIYGSMLCLSADNFQTFCFATVAGDKNNDRNAGELSRGIVWIKFETQSSNEEFAKINPLLSLTMIESQAYFEAYRYNLQALQSFDSENFPLKDQLIKVSEEINDLPYLSETTGYDLRDLAYPLVKISSEQFASIKAKYDASKNTSLLSLCETLKSETKINDNELKLLDNVSVLDDNSWPKPEVLGFDESQFEAFKAALTKQMVVIQGPPGTGKTYIGLRIVQTLLRNSKHWNGVESKTLVDNFASLNSSDNNQTDNLLFKESTHKPILIVCYTNHALDQFLEGMVPFCRDIVRIGGRSRSEILDSCTLFNVKRKLKEERDMPDPLFSSIKQSKDELESIHNSLSRLHAYIDQYSKRLISAEELQKLYTNGCTILSQVWQFYGNDLNYALVQWLIEKSDDHVYNAITHTIIGHEERIDESEVQKAIDSRVMDDEYRYNINGNSEAENNTQNIGMDDGFSVKLSKTQKSKLIRSMRHELVSYDVMSYDEYLRVANIAQLSYINRWRIYRYWVLMLCHSTQIEIEKLHREYAILMRSYNKLKLEDDLRVIRGCDVIGMTTTGAAKFRSIIDKINPSIVVIEEAAEVIESHVITSLTKNTNHLILIGDHRQLKPNPNVYELAKQFKLDVSLFERLINNGMPYYQLKLQHRMRPCISSLLVPHFYNELRDHESVRLYDSIKGISRNMFFVNHNELESYYSDSSSKLNVFEAQYIVKLCKYIIEQNYKPSQITIIVMYSAQLFEVKNLMKENQNILDGVRVAVIDNYQGEENDIILVSFVRSNIEGSIGFLQISNRVNVALSRAKMGLYCIGNFDCLTEHSELWTNIVKDLNEQKAIGPHLELFCQNHPDLLTHASKASDFSEVPDGGCNKTCEYRLDCGHKCPKSCHSYDPEHELIECPIICDKPYENCEHKCRSICHYPEPCEPCPVGVTKFMPNCGHQMKMKCSDEPRKIKCTFICHKPYVECEHECQRFCHFGRSCDRCPVLVMKSMPKCGHQMEMKCSDDPLYIKCTKPCERIMSCDHKCADICGNACDALKCNERIICLAACSHFLFNTICAQKYNQEKLVKYCTDDCGATLKCGHRCGGSCNECQQNRLHTKCEMKCERVLICGHVCNAVCGDNCPPCSERCEKSCNHSRCEHECGEPCALCWEPCVWKCDHKQCGGYCYENCDREMCSKRCKKQLKCGHNCIGICGERCPNICRICDKEEFESIFFGDEDERSNAIFIQLEDCGHVVEYNDVIECLSTMNANIEQNSDRSSNTLIQIKRCPKCDACIRKTKIFNDSLRDIEVVKKKLYNCNNEKEKLCATIADNKSKLFSKVDASNIDKYLDRYSFNEDDAKNKRYVRLRYNLLLKISQLSIQTELVKSNTELSIIQTKFDIINQLMKLSEVLSRHQYSCCIDEFKTKRVYARFAKFLAYINTIGNNEQQLRDTANEMNFFLYCCELSKIAVKRDLTAESKSNLVSAFKLLFSSGPFTDEKKRQIRELVEEGVKQCGECGVTLNEKKIAIKTMSLRSDDWFKCANGHVFCVGECGGQCPQCCDAATVVARFHRMTSKLNLK